MSKLGELTGDYFIDGCVACAEGALKAGCRFFGGYPITPATGIAEHMAKRMPQLGGTYIQMEDEIASIASILGASCAGVKSMTATSGPGFSLMMENYGLGAMTETPCVIVNMMRGGPSTGLPTMTAQGDVMQTRWGTHGDIGVIAYAPSSPQEMFDTTIRAFNMSEKYRLPVVILGDEMIAHMTEKVIIPPLEEVDIINRKRPRGPPEEYLPFKPDEDLVPPMACAGDGYATMVTGLTHDDRGYPVMNPDVHSKLVSRLINKVVNHIEDIVEYEDYMMKGADVLVVAYGSVSRSAKEAIAMAREQGIKAGLLRPLTVWPFPEYRLKHLAKRMKAIIVPEVNFGQMAYEVERISGPYTQTYLVPKFGGNIHTPEEILDAILEMV